MIIQNVPTSYVPFQMFQKKYRMYESYTRLKKIYNCRHRLIVMSVLIGELQLTILYFFRHIRLYFLHLKHFPNAITRC